MNDNVPYSGTPGIAGGPPAPPRVARVRFGRSVLTQAGMALAVVVLAWALDVAR